MHRIRSLRLVVLIVVLMMSIRSHCKCDLGSGIHRWAGYARFNGRRHLSCEQALDNDNGHEVMVI